MKAVNDTKTADLLPSHDLAGERPAPVNKAALRAAKFRDAHGVKAMTVNIDIDTLAAFDAWLKKHGKNRSAVIQNLLVKQVLRPR